MGKLLAFPSNSRVTQAKSADVKRAARAAAVEQRWQRIELRSGRTWMVLAWVLAVGRLQAAIARHEVFGAEDALAFMLAVLMPIMRAHKILEVVRDTLRFVRDKATGRSREGRSSDVPPVSKSACL